MIATMRCKGRKCEKKARNSPSHSTIRDKRPANPIFVTAIAIHHITSGEIRPSTGSIRRIPTQPRRHGGIRGRSGAVARLAPPHATKSRAGPTCAVHVAAIAPHAGTEKIPMLVATSAVRAVDICAHAGALIARAWRTVRSRIRGSSLA
jgi:hypothetical protein